jgi:hypothetical protein
VCDACLSGRQASKAEQGSAAGFIIITHFICRKNNTTEQHLLAAHRSLLQAAAAFDDFFAELVFYGINGFVEFDDGLCVVE